MFIRNKPYVNKMTLANLVVEHLVEIGIDAQLQSNRTNSESFTDRVLVKSEELGLIHITATANKNPTRIDVYGKVDSPHLADKNYFAYGWNTENGIDIQILKKQYIEGKASIKIDELITLSEKFLFISKSNNGEYRNSLFVDQFSNRKNSVISERLTNVYSRSSVIRQVVLHRAQGICEFCQMKGFESNNGNLYLETHHIVPLSEDGEDTIENIIALCPNDHRKAHYEKNTELTTTKLLKIVKSKLEA